MLISFKNSPVPSIQKMSISSDLLNCFLYCLSCFQSHFTLYFQAHSEWLIEENALVNIFIGKYYSDDLRFCVIFSYTKV